VLLPLHQYADPQPTALNTTATLHHITHIPASIPRSRVLTCLHNHDLLIRLDPELAHYETLPSEPSPSKTSSTAPNAPATSTSATKHYRVTDNMHTLPKGLWDTTVTFDADITDTEDGIEWIIRAPLGLVQRTTWRVVLRASLREDERRSGDREGILDGGKEGEEGEWSLVEDVEIKANRVIVGTVRGKCESNWRGVHGRFMGHVKETKDGE
jgi:hypothetical protein